MRIVTKGQGRLSSHFTEANGVVGYEVVRKRISLYKSDKKREMLSRRTNLIVTCLSAIPSFATSLVTVGLTPFRITIRSKYDDGDAGKYLAKLRLLTSDHLTNVMHEIFVEEAEANPLGFLNVSLSLRAFTLGDNRHLLKSGIRRSEALFTSSATFHGVANFNSEDDTLLSAVDSSIIEAFTASYLETFRLALKDSSDPYLEGTENIEVSFIHSENDKGENDKGENIKIGNTDDKKYRPGVLTITGFVVSIASLVVLAALCVFVRRTSNRGKSERQRNESPSQGVAVPKGSKWGWKVRTPKVPEIMINATESRSPASTGSIESSKMTFNPPTTISRGGASRTTKSANTIDLSNFNIDAWKNGKAAGSGTVLGPGGSAETSFGVDASIIQREEGGSLIEIDIKQIKDDNEPSKGQIVQEVVINQQSEQDGPTARLTTDNLSKLNDAKRSLSLEAKKRSSLSTVGKTNIRTPHHDIALSAGFDGYMVGNSVDSNMLNLDGI